MTTQVFISYAKEDKSFAEKLYNDLRQAGVNPWLDCVDLMPGQLWEKAIRSAISKSSYFLAILSSRSVSKKGFVQREIRYALEIAEEYPEDKIFIIPVRIDKCEPSFEDLQKLHRADLFPSYESGLERLLRTLKYEQEEKPRLVLFSSRKWAGTIDRITDRGFGFLTPEDRYQQIFFKDIFFHANELNGVSFDELHAGDLVTCQLAEGPKGWVAVNIAKS